MLSTSPIVYGPVPSWRFGKSLGIDPTLPPKKCSQSCVYCQLGRTEEYHGEPTDDPSFTSPNELKVALWNHLQNIDKSSFDLVLFTGSGEPTLNSRLAELIITVRETLPEKPVGILTNGTMMHHEMVRGALMSLDLVTVKLDAGDEKTHKSIHRPRKGSRSIDKMIDDYAAFRKEFRGWMTVEVMLLKSKSGRCSNLFGTARENLIKAILHINPDVVELEIPFRPPTLSDIIAPTENEIGSFAAELRKHLGHDRVWVYGERKVADLRFRWRMALNPERVFAVIKHRRSRIEDLVTITGSDERSIKSIVQELVDAKRVIAVDEEGETAFIVSED